MPFKPQTPEQRRACLSREHNPPSHIVLPPGTHTWVCPSCGQETTVRAARTVCQQVVEARMGEWDV